MKNLIEVSAATCGLRLVALGRLPNCQLQQRELQGQRSRHALLPHPIQEGQVNKADGVQFKNDDQEYGGD